MPQTRVVLFDLGRCATAGDAAVWLPKERLLITGRLSSAGRVEATMDTDLVSWFDALERLQGLGPKIVIPGHGKPGGAEVLRDQVERLSTLQEEVEKGTPETCPSCKEPCTFTDVTCYTPECGGPESGNFDPRL